MTEKNRKRKKDPLNTLSGMMVAAIVLAVVFYGFVAVATIHKGSSTPGEREQQETKNTDEAGTRPEADTGDEQKTPAPSESSAPVPIPVETVSPDEVTVETKAASEPRQIAALSMERLAQLEAEFDTAAQTYMAAAPVEKDADGRAKAANELIARFAEVQVPLTVYCADADTKKTAFVFYVPAEAGSTEAVLDVLKTYGIRTTFYITHYFAVHSSDLVRRMVEEGHEIGNLSYAGTTKGIIQDRSLTDIMTDALNQQTYVRTVYGQETQKYAFPFDSYSVAAGKTLSETGFKICFPSVRIDDADMSKAYDRNALLGSLEASLHPGAVYAFHSANAAAADILPDLISYATREGYVIKQPD